jgi:ubiquinone biosynthesis protein COQ9
MAIVGGKLKYMEECLKRLKKVDIDELYIFTSMERNNNNIVQYLLENGYYSNYDEIAQIAAKNGNYDMIKWLFDKYDKYNFTLYLIESKVLYNNYDEIKQLLAKKFYMYKNER